MNLADMFLYVSTTKWEGGDSVCFGFSQNFIFCYSLCTLEFPPLAQSKYVPSYYFSAQMELRMTVWAYILSFKKCNCTQRITVFNMNISSLECIVLSQHNNSNTGKCRVREQSNLFALLCVLPLATLYVAAMYYLFIQHRCSAFQLMR